MMHHTYTLRKTPGKKHYIAIVAIRENDKYAMGSYHIVAASYDQAMNVARNIFFDSSGYALENLIEINIDSKKDENNLIEEKTKDFLKTYNVSQEAIEKLKNMPIPEPKLEPVNSMTYWNNAKKKDEFKFCPFRFDSNGRMRRCVGHTCMAYMVDSEDCSHYCARLKKGE